MTNQTRPSPRAHKLMAVTVAEQLEKLKDTDPWLSKYLRTYITSLRAESARNRVRVKQLEAELRGGDRHD